MTDRFPWRSMRLRRTSDAAAALSSAKAGAMGVAPARPATFKGVQALRGIAACMVVVHHATLFYSRISSAVPEPMGDQSRYWMNGAAGVDIFFVISGFVMAVSTIGKDLGTHPARTFLERRLLRIAPMYWVVSLMFLAEFLLLVPFPQLKTRGEFYTQLTPDYVVTSLLLLPSSRYSTMVGVAWTLRYECFFYLLFAAALAMRVGVVWLLTPLMCGLVLFGLVHPGSGGGGIYAICTSPLLLEFLAGVYIGKALLNGYRMNPWLAALLGVAGFVLLLSPANRWFPVDRSVTWGIPAAMVVLSAAFLEERFGGLWPRFMLLLGDASYSLYLVHILCICVVARVFERMRVLSPGPYRTQDELLMAVTCFSVAVPFSLLLYKRIEQPLQQLLRPRSRRKEAPRVQVA